MRYLISALVLAAVGGPLQAADANACTSCADEPAFSLEAAYSGEAWRQASGGIRTGGRYLDNLDLRAVIDGKRLLGIEGLTLFGAALYNNGQGLAEELTGATQGVSNIEAVRAVRLYELWGEWRIGAQQSLRVGLYDLNSEFDSIEAAGLFIHPSQGIGPDFAQSGENGPSIFPATSLALRAKRTLGTWSLQAAVLDAVPGDVNHPRRTQIKLARREGALLVTEIGRDFAGLRMSVGYWQYTADFADLSSESLRRDDNAGAYLIVASPKLWAGPAEQGLDLYARAGQAQSHINPIGEYVGAGAVYTGVFAANGADQLGLSVAIAELGAPFRRAQADLGAATTQRESVFELTYRLNLNEWLAVQPDVQYIRHPGMDPQRAASWLFGLRVDLSRVWSR